MNTPSHTNSAFKISILCPPATAYPYSPSLCVPSSTLCYLRLVQLHSLASFPPSPPTSLAPHAAAVSSSPSFLALPPFFSPARHAVLSKHTPFLSSRPVPPNTLLPCRLSPLHPPSFSPVLYAVLSKLTPSLPSRPVPPLCCPLQTHFFLAVLLLFTPRSSLLPPQSNTFLPMISLPPPLPSFLCYTPRLFHAP